MNKLLLGLLTVATLAAPIGLVSASSATAAPVRRDCLSFAEWQQIGEGMPREQVDAIAGVAPATEQPTYYSDGEIDYDAYYPQCDQNGVRSPNGSDTVWISFDNDYGYDSNFNLVTGPFHVDYKGSWSPVDLVVTEAMAAKSAKYCGRAEYRALTKGLTTKRVARILDGPGKRDWIIGSTEYRQYGSDNRSPYMYCAVEFKHGRLAIKHRYASSNY